MTGKLDECLCNYNKAWNDLLVYVPMLQNVQVSIAEENRTKNPYLSIVQFPFI